MGHLRRSYQQRTGHRATESLAWNNPEARANRPLPEFPVPEWTLDCRNGRTPSSRSRRRSQAPSCHASTRSSMLAGRLGEGVPMRQWAPGTVSDRYSPFLSLLFALATSAGLVGATQPAGAGTRSPGIACEHVTGTTGGVVTLSSCHSGGQARWLLAQSQESYSFPAKKRLE